MPRHESHLPQGSDVGSLLLRQLRALAKMRAVDVFPVPRVPQKRNAWATRPESIAFFNVCATWSWPTSSSKSAERYLRARTVYDIAVSHFRASDLIRPAQYRPGNRLLPV